MLDIKFFRETPKDVFDSEKRRGSGIKFAEAVIKNDKLWREAKYKLEKIHAERNKVSLEINQLKKQKKPAKPKIQAMHKVIKQINIQTKKVQDYLQKREQSRAQVGNILDPSVPKGESEADNVPINFCGKKTKFNFPHKDHIELGLALDLFEFDTAAKVAGARFVYFKNEAAILDLALQKFAVDTLVRNGFSMIWPPMMLNLAATSSTASLKEFKEQTYKIDGEDLYLIGTSELPLIALKANKTLAESELPIKLGAFSSCFRKEAGSHGRDTKGTIRMHQFNKVEEVVYCRPEDSKKYFTELQRITEGIWKSLGIPFRVVNLCTGDLGNKQALQYDIVAWFPGQNNKKGAYREVTSCSNCTDFQAVNLNTKFARKNTGKREYVHILNNTAIATSRAIPAILENFQQKDGSVKIPQPLWTYTGFKVIKAKK